MKKIKEMKKAANLTETLNCFKPGKALTAKELPGYFVERPWGSLNVMETYLRGANEPVKILFTGHRGSGKSTELRKLSSLLENTFFIVSLSIDKDLDLFDIKHIDVILAMALKLLQKAYNEGIKIKEDILQDVFDWLTKEIIKEMVIEIPQDVTLSANLNLLALKIEGKLGSETLSRTVMREKIAPRLSELMEKINTTIREIEEITGKKVLIITEDMDKTDISSARHLFFDHGSSLSKINSRVIYTFPISLRYSKDFPQVAHNFDMHFVLPNVKISNKQGVSDPIGYKTLKEVILRRIEEDLITEEALDEVIQFSGGLMRELVRLIQGAANYALSQEKIVIDVESVRTIANEIRNDYRALLREEHYKTLNLIKKDNEKKIVNDEITQELLHNLSLLEYRNGETWGDVHPIVASLLE
ncbi:MAG: hypothetical protein QME81_07660 [bacterium]|nr:hypothetical protein [bacterium]